MDDLQPCEVILRLRLPVSAGMPSETKQMEKLHKAIAPAIKEAFGVRLKDTEITLIEWTGE